MSTDRYSGSHTIKVTDGSITLDANDIEFGGALELASGLTISSGGLIVSSGSITASSSAISAASLTASGAVSATGGFTGDVTGDVTGNVTGSSSSCTGNAATATIAAAATILETARTIGGVSFDGSANIIPDTISVSTTTNSSSYLGIWTAASHSGLGPKTSSKITCDASTGNISLNSGNGRLYANVTGDLTGEVTGSLIADTPGGYTIKVDGPSFGVYDGANDFQGGIQFDESTLFPKFQFNPENYIAWDEYLHIDLTDMFVIDWPGMPGPWEGPPEDNPYTLRFGDIANDIGMILRVDQDNLGMNPIDESQFFRTGGIELRAYGGHQSMGNITLKDADMLSVLDGALTFSTGLGTINGQAWGLDGNDFMIGDLKFNTVTRDLTSDLGGLMFDGESITDMASNISTNAYDIGLIDVSFLNWDDGIKDLGIPDMISINTLPFRMDAGIFEFGNLRFNTSTLDMYLDSGDFTVNGLDVYRSGNTDYMGSLRFDTSTYDLSHVSANIKMNGMDMYSSGSTEYMGNLRFNTSTYNLSHATEELKFNGMDMYSSGGVDHIGDYAQFASSVVTQVGGGVVFDNGFTMNGSGDITSAVDIGQISVAANGSVAMGYMNVATSGAISGDIGDFTIASNGAISIGVGIISSISYLSDRNMKTNISTIDNGLEKVLGMRAVSYNWNEEFLANRLKPGINDVALNKSKYGFIAQEIAELVPDLVLDPKDLDPEFDGKPLSLDFNGILPFLVSAIQEQQVMIEELQAEVAALKSN